MILEKSSKLSNTQLFPLFVWNTVAKLLSVKEVRSLPFPPIKLGLKGLLDIDNTVCINFSHSAVNKRRDKKG